jgi:cytochrome b involved in lipid metabolism
VIGKRLRRIYLYDISSDNAHGHNHLASMSATTYTYEEVAKHNTVLDLWVIYNGKVYDVTSYVDEHPGGEEVVVDCAGTDATEAFDDIGHSDDAKDILQGLLIGDLEGFVPKKVAAASSSKLDSGLPVPLIAAVVLAAAVGAYFYLH